MNELAQTPMLTMTWEDKLTQMLDHLYEIGGSTEAQFQAYCAQQLGMDAQDYTDAMDRLNRDGMIEKNEHGRLVITMEGWHLAQKGGGYQALLYSPDYLKKIAKENRKRQKEERSFWGENGLVWFTGLALLVILGLVFFLLFR